MPVPDSSPSAAGSAPLFRQQAIEHLSARQYGTVVLARPLSHRVLTLLFCAIAAAIVLFFALFGTTRKAHSQGVLTPTAGMIRVLAGQAGIVAEARVREGQHVKKGEVLFVLSSERSGMAAASAEGKVSTLLRSRLDSFGAELQQSGLQARQRLEAAMRRAADLEEEVARADGQIGLQQTRVRLAEQAYQRYSQLQFTNYISPAQLQDKQAELLDQRQRMADLQRIRSASARELAGAQAEARDLRLQAQRETAALERNMSALQQDLAENEARRELFVLAPQDGMVTAITAQAGHPVSAVSSLAAVLPAGAELEAEIYVPSRSAGFVRPGMTVMLRYQAYPYQKFGQYRAVVREVAHSALRADEVGMSGATSALSPGEPVYRMRLTLASQSVLAYGRAMPLKPGMLVDASVMLEHRRLYEWVLEPLFSISGRHP